MASAILVNLPTFPQLYLHYFLVKMMMMIGEDIRELHTANIRAFLSEFCD